MAGGLLIAAALTVAAPARARPGGAPLRSSPIQVDDEGFVFVVNPDSNSVTRLSPLSGGTLGTLWEGLAGEYPRERAQAHAGAVLEALDTESATQPELRNLAPELVGFER